jgi:hypothetical protein
MINDENIGYFTLVLFGTLCQFNGEMQYIMQSCVSIGSKLSAS